MLKSKLLKRILCMTIVLIFLLSFSMSVFAVNNIQKTMTVNYTFYGPYNMDLMPVIPPTVNYSSDGFSGTLGFSSYTVKSQVYNPYDYDYTYNIEVVYSGYVAACASYRKTQTYSINIFSTPDTLESNICNAIGGNSIYYNDGYYSGTLAFSSYTVRSQEAYPYDYGYYSYNIDVVYSGIITFSAPSSLWKTQTYSINVCTTPDTLESSALTAIGGNSIGYNDGYYSGTLAFSSYTVRSQEACPYDYGYYSYNIDVVYSGTVYH